MTKITESVIEDLAVELFVKPGCEYVYAPMVSTDFHETAT